VNTSYSPVPENLQGRDSQAITQQWVYDRIDAVEGMNGVFIVPNNCRSMEVEVEYISLVYGNRVFKFYISTKENIH
jgi:hypothetical protein